MLNARRTYAYLVAAISLAVIFGATTWLLRDLLIAGTGSTTIDTALQIAILIIGVPVYLGHWLWQQRLAARNGEERGALGRRIYLYAMLASSVSVVLYSGYDLASLLLGVMPSDSYQSPATSSPLYYVIPICLAALVWSYHALLLRAESAEAPDSGDAGTVRRLYIYGFSAAGATMVSLSAIQLIRWLLSEIGQLIFHAVPLDVVLRPEMARLLIGLPLWLIYWRWANQLFESNSEERESVLRKFYLYAAIFIGTAGTVSTLATLLAGIFRQWLSLAPQGQLGDALALTIGFALIWFYHSLVLRQDLRSAEATAPQAEMRRLYLYLLAAVGLIAMIAGTISEISLFLRVVGQTLYESDKEQLAYSTAAIVAGLPLWLVAWRQVQVEAGRSDATGSQARQSPVRKFYIYTFQFISIMAMLGSAIYVVSKFVNWLLVHNQIDFNDIALPIAITLVHLLVWIYHWGVIRSDRTRTASDETRRLGEMGIVLVQKSGDRVVPAIYTQLQTISPELRLEPLPIDGESHGQAESLLPKLLERLANAQTIVVPSTVLALGHEASEWTRQVAQAIIASPARKVLLPVASPGWVWIGTEALDEDKVVQEAVATLRQLASGEKVHTTRRLGCGMIALIVLGVLFLISAGLTVYALNYSF